MVTLGIDEVGRGSWAGPLVVGAAIITKPFRGLKDSKLYSRAEREIIYSKLIKKCESYSLGWVWPDEIDALGLTKATILGIDRALAKISLDYDEIVIDGLFNFLPANPKVRCLIKADNLIPSVSAASVLAKVERDRYMINLANDYQDYGFDKHVGYGTKNHQAAVKKYGICAHHRKSYKPIANAL